MQLRIAVAFGIVIALWGAFMIHRHYKKEKALEAHAEEVYSVMTTAALKSPMAGLTYMGMALEKYHQDHQKYPQRITELFPEYIKDQEFIRAINWQYKSENDNYMLQKTITTNGQQRTAFTDKSLRPRMKDETVQVAAATTDQRPAVSSGSAPARERLQQSSPPASTASTLPIRQLSREKRKKMLEEMLAAAKTRTRFGLKDLEETKKYDSFFTVIGQADEVRPDLGRRYLVWKNEDGSLGFGNVLYPEQQQALVYQEGQWIAPTSAGVDPLLEKSPPWQSAAADSIADRYGRTYLAWRDDSGTLGFGNIHYPTSRLDAVYLDGIWLEEDIKAPASAIDNRSHVPDGASPSLNIVQRYSRQYLAWKDVNGSLGFGNIHYPTTRSQSIWQDGAWLDVDLETDDKNDGRPTDAFSRISRRNAIQHQEQFFFIWKDKNGAPGFSNIIYPSRKDIDIIMPDGSWRALPDDEITGGSHADE